MARSDPYHLVGCTLAGKYHLLDLVGIGGMGVVYRARHLVLEDDVALKILKPDLAIASHASRKLLEDLFIQEAKQTRKLDHRCIVKVTDVNVFDDISFLVMEWINGHTLEKELEQNGRLSTERIAWLLEQICEGMSHAHSKRIVHRDLKPGNIMLVHDEEGEEGVKILDFGIAKALNSTISRVIGAPYYASPEQLNVGLTIDQRSDVYSLGVMVYEMLTGKLPFDSDSIGAIVNQHQTAPPPLLREIQPDIPEPVEEVVLQALAKDPRDRYQSVDDLARAFRQAINLDVGTLILHCSDAQSGTSIAKASVYLNGRHMGMTNENGKWQKDDLLPRVYSIDIDRLQYLRWHSRITVTPQNATIVEAKLAAQESGALSIRTVVVGSASPLSGAQVLLNGQLIGTTDRIGLLHLADLTPGTFEIEVNHPNRDYKFTSEVEIVHSQEAHLDVEFPQESKRARSFHLPGLRWSAAALVVIMVIAAGIVFYRFSSTNSRTSELIEQIAEAGRLNDAGLKSLGLARSLGVLSRTLMQSEYASAETYFKKATDLDGRRDDYYNHLGYSLLYLGQFDQAQEAFNKAIGLNDANQEYRFDRDMLQRMLSKSAAGDPAYKYSHGPSLSMYYLERGNAFHEWQEFLCAEVEFRQAMLLDERNPESYFRQGQNFESLFYFHEAKPMYLQACKLAPADQRCENARASLFPLNAEPNRIDYLSQSCKPKS